MADRGAGAAEAMPPQSKESDLMWPYSSEEQVWLAPSKEWAEKLAQPAQPAAANENGAWPYATAGEVAEDHRRFDPQTFVGK